MTQDRGAYREAFFHETKTSLEAANAALVEAERTGKPEPLNEAFRLVHTIKGMAATMGYEDLAASCHAVEDVLDRARKGVQPLSDSADLLFRSLDELSDAIRGLEEGAAPAPRHPAEPARSTTLPVRTERLDVLMNLAEEMIVAKLRFDRLKETIQDPQLASAVDSLDRLASELQYQVTQARMSPIGLVFNRFPRLVRDLAKRQGKDIELVLEGGDIEVDRVVADEISESLVHLLRNAVDHGIEPVEERVRKGKPARGTIRVAASRAKNSAAIVVEDDGRGLDLPALRRAAALRGALPEDATDEEVARAIFSGISTTEEATAVSGRGLGLDIANRKMRSLGGSIAARPRGEGGTAFLMDVPLSLAIIKALFVDVGGRAYAVPLGAIERILAVSAAELRSSLGGEAVVYGDDQIRVVRLRRLFGLADSASRRFPVVVLGHDGARVGLLVDSLKNTQEIVLKPLNRLLRDVRFFSGFAIVGTGEPVLVLDVPGLRDAALEARA